MKKELKFRVWYVDEMIFSDCAIGEFDFIFDIDGNMEFVAWNDEIHKLTPDGDVTYSGWETHTQDIMQYIGLKDANNNEIYEGDIVEDEYGRIMLVEWHQYRWCFKAITTTNFIWAHNIDEWFEDDSPAPKIIGNIYTYNIDGCKIVKPTSKR